MYDVFGETQDIPQQEIVFVVGSPRLTEESSRGSLVDGHMIAVGWNMGEAILCNLSIFNAMTYQVALCLTIRNVIFLVSFQFAAFPTEEIPCQALSFPD
jgi:hypothetical protein